MIKYKWSCRALKAQPNNAHLALSAFSIPSIRHQISPSSNFTLITQNVDGLSVRADREIASLYPEDQEQKRQEKQPRIIEMHGRLFDVLCVQCRHVEFNDTSPICEALAGTEKLVERGTLDPVIAPEDLPRCSKCGGLTRPGVVWFGERPHHMDVIDSLIEDADLCIVVGTSSTVRCSISICIQICHTDSIQGPTRCIVCNRSTASGWQSCSIQFGAKCRGSWRRLSFPRSLRRDAVTSSMP